MKQYNQYDTEEEIVSSTQAKQRFLGAYQYCLCICQVKGLL